MKYGSLEISMVQRTSLLSLSLRSTLASSQLETPTLPILAPGLFCLSTIIQEVQMIMSPWFEYIILLMDTRELFRTHTFNKDFGFIEYITPHCQCDPKKQLLQRTFQDYKHRPKQQKFKIVTKPRECYFDQIASLTSDNPQPSRYKVEGNLKQRHRSASLKTVDRNTKKYTYIERIEEFQTKHKTPGVGKFDLTKYTDLGTKKFSNLKQKDKVILKHNNFDDVIKVAAQLPGPGQFNPHIDVQKIRPDRNDHKFWKNKHLSQEKRLAKSISTKICPNSYSPTVSGTFDSIAKDKSKPISRWTHGSIEIRKGIRSAMKDPSPCQYNTVHQWTSTDKKQKAIGNLNLLNRISSAGHFGVYH